MKRLSVRHQTQYSYGAPVDIGLHLLRLTPPAMEGQHPVNQALAIEPEPSRIEAFQDHFGNAVHFVAVEAMHDRFVVTLEAQVDVSRPAVVSEGPAWEEVRDSLRDDGFPAAVRVAEFVYPSPLAFPDSAASEYAQESFSKGLPIVAALRDLTARIHRDFRYAPNSTNVSTKAAEVLKMRRGVCQDFAHLMIATLRGLGIPARYVSGYVKTRASGGEMARTGSDATHAWVSVWCGADLGWVEFDPTNNLIVEDEHIVLAYGREFPDATPLHGVILGGGRHTLQVEVAVRGEESAE